MLLQCIINRALFFFCFFNNYNLQFVRNIINFNVIFHLKNFDDYYIFDDFFENFNYNKLTLLSFKIALFNCIIKDFFFDTKNIDYILNSFFQFYLIFTIEIKIKKTFLQFHFANEKSNAIVEL